jgi:hypothetical protein
MSSLADVNSAINTASFVGGNRTLTVCVSGPALPNGSLSNDEFYKIASESYIQWIRYFSDHGIFPQPEYETYNPSLVIAQSKQKYNVTQNLVRVTPTPEELETDASFFNQKKGMFHRTTFPVITDIDRQGFPLILSRRSNCDSADLKIQIGRPLPEGSQEFGQDQNLLGRFSKISERPSRMYPEDPNWHPSIIDIYQSDFGFSEPLEIRYIVMHELGHMFGIPHIKGTIMDPEVLKTIASQLKSLAHVKDPILRKQLLPESIAIDHWRILSPCANESYCLSLGVQYNSADGIIGYSELKGMRYYDFRFDSTKPIGSERIEFSILNSEIKPENKYSSALEEILVRPQMYNPTPIYHKAIEVDAWRNNEIVAKTTINMNQPIESPVQVTIDCLGSHTSIFKSNFHDGLTDVSALGWTLSSFQQSYEALASYEDCARNKAGFDTSRSTTLKEVSKELNESIITVLESGFFQLPNASIATSMLPAQNDQCTSTSGKYGILKSNKICIWRSGNFSVLHFTDNGGQKFFKLEKIYDDITKKSAGRYTESWKVKFTGFVEVKSKNFKKTFPSRLRLNFTSPFNSDQNRYPPGTQVQVEFSASEAELGWFDITTLRL